MCVPATRRSSKSNRVSLRDAARIPPVGPPTCSALSFAVVPLLVMWFGIGAVPAVLTAFLLAFFPVAVNVAVGLATLEAELSDVLRVLGASRWQIFRKVGVPRTMPLFFASLKVAVSSAFVGSVISETVASNAGIGYLMAVAASDFNTRLAFGGLFVLGAMGVLLYGVFAVKLFFVRDRDHPRWTLPVAGGTLFAVLVALWGTSAYWYFTQVRFGF